MKALIEDITEKRALGGEQQGMTTRWLYEKYQASPRKACNVCILFRSSMHLIGERGTVSQHLKRSVEISTGVSWIVPT